MICPIWHGELQTHSGYSPFCGTKLDTSGITGPASIQTSHSSHIGLAIGLIVLLVVGGLFATGALTPDVTKLVDDARNALHNLTCLSPGLCGNSTYPTTNGKATYDQQVSLIFAQSYQSLTYNVTAVAQTDSSGFGPAYLLNGLSDSGYWYQVGLAYNWPLASGSSYDPGFHFIWEVFLPNGTTNNPVLSRTPDNVNSGDTVSLSLSFQGGSVAMYSSDPSTGASSSHTYTAGGGTIFTGSSSARSSRTPTSLMTEWYHSGAYETTMKSATYTEVGPPIQSAWVCIGEYVPPNSNSIVYAQCSSALILTSQMQSYSFHGLNTYASQYSFQTGPS